MSASKEKQCETLNASKLTMHGYSKNYVPPATASAAQYGPSSDKKKFPNPYAFTRTNTSKNLGLTSKFSK